MTPQDAWVSDPTFGVDPTVITTNSSPVSSADTPPPVPATATSPDAGSDTAGPPPPSDAAPVASGPDSDSYKSGYQDGLSGQDANPGPLAPDSLTDYQEGYAKGHYEFSQKNASQVPVSSAETPPPAPATATAPDAGPDTPAPPPPSDAAPAASGPDSDSYKSGY